MANRRKCCDTPKGDGSHLPNCCHAGTVATSDDPRAFRKNRRSKCFTCGESPTVGDTGLCGPCCFGEAATYGGNW